jgi:sugar lactone lactonase YvrE
VPPSPTGAEEIVLAEVSCASSSSCTAVGFYYQQSSGKWVTLAERWNGTQWSIQTTPSVSGAISSRLLGVSCASSTACTAVGYYQNNGTQETFPFAERWNGTEWQLQTTPSPPGMTFEQSALQTVSCSSSTSCTAVGGNEGTKSGEYVYLPLVERWNGTEWAIQSTPNPTGAIRSELGGVSCPSSTWCTVVGSYENSSEAWVTLAERWNGTEWQVQSTPNPSGSTVSLLRAVSCTSSSVCTAVGTAVGGPSAGEAPFAEHWNGAEWVVQAMAAPDGTVDAVWGISCISSKVCVAAGESGESALVERETLPAATTEQASGLTSSEATLNGTVNPEESDTHYHFEYGPTTSYGASTAEVDAGSGTANVKPSQAVTGLEPGGGYHFRLVASNVAGTSYGVDGLFTTSIALPPYLSAFGSHGSGPGQLGEATALATDPSGNVWIADWQNSRLEEFNSTEELVRTVGSHGSGNGQFEGLDAVAVDGTGHVWAAECATDRVDKFSPEGVFEHAYGSKGIGNGQFECPSGLAVDSKGDVYVADRYNHRIAELDSEGKYVRKLSKSGATEGPFALTFDASGNLWASYAWDGQVAEFASEGESPIRVWGSKGTAAGQLEDAYGLKVGPGGNIWLAEWGNDRVQVFTPGGEYLYGFGGHGSGNGQFIHPEAIGISGANVYVLDTGNSRVEKWGL